LATIRTITRPKVTPLAIAIAIVGLQQSVAQPQRGAEAEDQERQAAERSRAWRVRKVRTTCGRKLRVVQVPAINPRTVIPGL